MRMVEKLAEQVRRLPVVERRQLLRLIEESLDVEDPAADDVSPRDLYTHTLALAGSMHADATDVSTDKYRHLADALADRRDGR